jgi:hypothetical protein
MPRLTNKEIIELKRQLFQWQLPDTMLHLVDGTMDQTGSVDLFNQGGLAFLRDAWIAAKFGQIRQAKQVRLVSETWPDFELQIGDRIEAFEAVEADDPERRRGDEYRNSTGEIKQDPVEDWIARADQASTWLEIACQKKAGKHYGARVNLVVYLNISEYGIRQKEVEGSFSSSTAAAKNDFDTVWILWKDQAHLVWKSDGTHH